MAATKARNFSDSPLVVVETQTSVAHLHHQTRHLQNQANSSYRPANSQRQTDSPSGEFDMTVDEHDEMRALSSSPGRSTIAYCKQCGVEFGEFYNSWTKVTGSYYLPCLVGSYRFSGLRPRGKPKPASAESALVECSIQPLVCDNCDDTLGIFCTNAPESKKQYAQRDFFKLPKIDLKSDATGQVVDAIIELDHLESSRYQERSVPPGRSIMEAHMEESAGHARKPSAPSMPIHTPPTHQIAAPEDIRRQDAIPSRPLASHPPQSQSQKPMYHEREPAPQNRHNERGVPYASPVNGHMHTNGPPAGYPSNIAVKLEAIDRIQTQVNLNRATLESCTRDIGRLEGNFIRLQQSVADHLDALQREMMQSRQHTAAAMAASAPPQGDRLDDQALEVFSNALSNVASKANEVDSLRLQMEMIKRKIKRLEENSSNAPPTPYPSSARESSMHHTPAAQTAMTPIVSQMTPPSRPEVRPPGNYRGNLPSQTPDVAHPPHALDEDPAGSGWVSVNHGAKRGLSNGVDGRSDAEGTPIGSPKRPKLAPLEPQPRIPYEAAPPGPIRFERMDTDESTPSQRQSTEVKDSYPDSTNPSTFIPYTNHHDAEENWRAESQHAAGLVLTKMQTQATRSPRGRGRGRGGRPRKSLPVEVHTLRTPEWEKETWSGSQIGSDNYYHPGVDRGGLVRRGSGGGQGMQAASPESSMGDPYGHTKKTRTKPIRNADGVLIRKDGRPDMRSQSSAANLRKVHARKEEEKRMEPGMTPTSALATEPTTGAGSPDSQVSSEHNEFTSTQARTNHIMKKMFPKGMDEQRGILNSPEQYFPSAGHSPVETKPLTSHSQSEAPTRDPSELQDHSDSRDPSEGHRDLEDHHDEDERMEDRPVMREDRFMEREHLPPLPQQQQQSHPLHASNAVSAPAVTAGGAE